MVFCLQLINQSCDLFAESFFTFFPSEKFYSFSQRSDETWHDKCKLKKKNSVSSFTTHNPVYRTTNLRKNDGYRVSSHF